jgi:glycosyltransferase involved in cell wall biosynthesis
MTSAGSDISVIIPYYNREKYIDEAIKSVQVQTLHPLEIIIVNDCSRESSRRYLDRYRDICKIVDLTANVGLAGARNAGIRVARGKFIALLDDDDVWLPQKLDLQRRYLDEHPECSIVCSAVWGFFSNRPDELWTSIGSRPLTLAEALTHEYWVVVPTMVIRSEVAKALGGFDARFRFNEDRDFVIRCSASGYRIEGVQEPLVRVRREAHHRLTRQHVRMFLGHAKVCWIHKALFYRVYGVRGIVSFLLSSLHLASMETRYVDGAVRRLCRLIKIKWEVKPGYREPVQFERLERLATDKTSALSLPGDCIS